MEASETVHEVLLGSNYDQCFEIKSAEWASLKGFKL